MRRDKRSKLADLQMEAMANDPDIQRECKAIAAECRFDYSKAKPNRFAARAKAGYLTVTLDPDVAKIFTSAEAVNSVLRALIATMPKTAQN